MGLNPALILGGILAMAVIAIAGVIWTPQKTTEILGFCGMITGTLLLLLKQDRDVKKVQQRLDASDEVTKQEAKILTMTIATADVKKVQDLTTIKEGIQHVIKQNNGEMDKKFEAQTAAILEAMPKVIEEVVPKVVAPIVAPGKDK